MTTTTTPTPARPALHTSPASISTPIPPDSVVVGVDDSAHAAEALAWAADQAAAEHRRLVLLHATDPLGSATRIWLTSVAIDPAELRRDIESAGDALLERAASSARARHPQLEVVPAMRLLDPRQALVDVSSTASLVVVGSRGHGPVGSLLLGSVSVAVAKHARSRVVVVRPAVPGARRRGVLVGVDGTARSLPALEAAYEQAAARRVPLTVMHCFWDVLAATSPAHRVTHLDPTVGDLRLLVAEVVAGMSERHPDVEVRLELARGLVEEVLGQESRSHELVVVGHHRSGPLVSLLRGSIAGAVLEHASCPVLVVPDRGHQASAATGTKDPAGR